MSKVDLILNKVFKNLNSLNDFLELSNSRIEGNHLFELLDNHTKDINSDDPNVFLATLINLTVNNIDYDVVFDRDDSNKFLIVTFLNTILSTSGMNLISYEVI